MNALRRGWPALACAAVILVGLVLASTANAATDLRLSVEPQKVASFVTSIRLSPAVRVAADIYCKTRSKRVKAKNVLGKTLWWYQQRLRWCWKVQIGQVAKITAATARCAGTTYRITSWGYWWDFVRHVDCQYAGGVGSRYVTRFRQGHFRYCPLRTGCIQNKFPWAWVRGHAGGVSYAGGGGA
jgi:hypothetical protein